MRLGVGLLAGRPFDSMLAGDASLCRRPMARVMAPLALMGALIESRGTSGRPPLAVRGQPLRGIVYELPVPSAQVKSAILLAGLQAEGETVVIESAPTRDHTERLLPEFGVPVRVELVRSDVDSVLGRRIAVNRAALRGTSITVPGDLSAAAFFIVAAALVDGSEIVIPDVGLNPTRCGILTVLERMGAKITVDPQPIGSGPEPVGTLVVSGGALRGIEVDPALVPSLIDEVPILCVAAACASGETRITGAAELRVKESDRIAAMTTELRALGVQVEELTDGLVIEGKGRAGIDRQLRGGRRSSHGDHRIAMALGVAGLMADGGVAIDDAAVADVSFPGFYDQLRALMEG
jgi:3-phosphoshikimate 1-carboxyvinyltransferase